MSEVDFRLAHSLNAVLGWLELGNTREARAELRALPAEYREDTNVLDLAWLLDAREGNWDGALEVAERFLEARPECALAWLHRAYALRRASHGGLEQAAEALRPAAELFPDEPVIAFNLACYACQLDDLEGARRWLKESIRRGEDGEIRAMALADRDLERLWPEIQKW
jgi:Flp pilus assembly protein TadD